MAGEHFASAYCASFHAILAFLLPEIDSEAMACPRWAAENGKDRVEEEGERTTTGQCRNGFPARHTS